MKYIVFFPPKIQWRTKLLKWNLLYLFFQKWQWYTGLALDIIISIERKKRIKNQNVPTKSATQDKPHSFLTFKKGKLWLEDLYSRFTGSWLYDPLCFRPAPAVLFLQGFGIPVPTVMDGPIRTSVDKSYQPVTLLGENYVLVLYWLRVLGVALTPRC